MERVLAALAQRDRIGIVLWLIKNGPARQVELLEVVEADRRGPVNPGTVTALLKPLLEAGLLVRDRPRGPISVKDPAQTMMLLRTAASINVDRVDEDKAHAERGFDSLRRAVVRSSRADAKADASS